MAPEELFTEMLEGGGCMALGWGSSRIWPRECGHKHGGGEMCFVLMGTRAGKQEGDMSHVCLLTTGRHRGKARDHVPAGGCRFAGVC